MNYQIDIQVASQKPLPVTQEQLIFWTELALSRHQDCAELTIRIVDQEEMEHLNSTYRKKNAPTNVLAFPSDLPAEIKMDYPLLGDIIICPEVLKKESLEQNKPQPAHWAHIVIHGVLHLLGYDHIKEQEEKIMQNLEIELLTECGFANPYDEEDLYFEKKG
jgi:probable rRNA maturation factor